MKYIFSLLITFVIGSALSAQVLTLDSCRILALNNNTEILKAAYTVESAHQQQLEAFTKYFPALTAGATYFKADKSPLAIDLSSLTGQPNGLTILEDGLFGNIMATWPIFVGGQIINGNRLAKVGYEVAQLQYLQTRNEVALTAEEYYWRIVLIQEKHTTLIALQKHLSSIANDAQNAVEAGLSLNNDLLQVQLRQNEVESKLSSLESSLEVFRMLLCQYCGLSVDHDIKIAYDTLSFEKLDTPGSLFVQPQSALENTPEYDLLEKNCRVQLLKYRMEVGKNLPSVAMMGGYTYNDLPGSSVNRMVGAVNVSIPITGWWGGSHTIRQKKNAVKIARLDQEDNEQKLVIRMTSAYNCLEDAYRQTLIAKRSLIQATENFRIATECYRAGTCSMTECLEAQSFYQQSRDGNVETFTHYHLKRLEYLQATGR